MDSAALEVFECEQGSIEWHHARCGIITASCFKDVLTKDRSGKGMGKTAKTYAYKVAGERVRGEPAEVFGSFHMERGQIYEDEAIDVYCERTGNQVRRIGFMKRGNIGASADALVIDQPKGLEIKTRLSHLHVEMLINDEVPKENEAQVQGNMLIAGCDEWDYSSYCPGLPPFIKTVKRDDDFINMLEEELAAFDEYVEEIVKQIMGKF